MKSMFSNELEYVLKYYFFKNDFILKRVEYVKIT